MHNPNPSISDPSRRSTERLALPIRRRFPQPTAFPERGCLAQQRDPLGLRDLPSHIVVRPSDSRPDQVEQIHARRMGWIC
jgi:hypothetical protein